MRTFVAVDLNLVVGRLTRGPRNAKNNAVESWVFVSDC